MEIHHFKTVHLVDKRIVLHIMNMNNTHEWRKLSNMIHAMKKERLIRNKNQHNNSDVEKSGRRSLTQYHAQYYNQTKIPKLASMSSPKANLTPAA